MALRSLDTTYQDLASAINTANTGYALNSSREPSNKPQGGAPQNNPLNTTLINLAQASGNKGG